MLIFLLCQADENVQLQQKSQENVSLFCVYIISGQYDMRYEMLF